MRQLLLAFFILFPLAAMADEYVKVDSTSVCFGVRVSDSSSGTGAGLSGLAYNSGSLVCSYFRPGVVGATRTAITLASSTLGTYTSGAFKEIDATHLKGSYEFCPPNAAFASATGLREVLFECYGATNMAPMVVRAIMTDAYPQVDIGKWNGTAVTGTAPTSSAIYKH